MLTLMPAERRVVITGLGIISPVGCDSTSFWNALSQGESGISWLEPGTSSAMPAGKVHSFSGKIGDFGELATDVKKKLRKALKIMNRETRMGVAAALQALSDSNLKQSTYAAERMGVSFGAGYVSMLPEDFEPGMQACLSQDDTFEIDRWGEDGLHQVAPLWILKCLPNMPACHIAIYAEMQGPNNSITQGDASANFAIAEAARIMRDGDADLMLVGGTGDTLLPFSRMHSMLEQDVANCDSQAEPSQLCKPFDQHRQGTVLGEGSAAFILEDYSHAVKRNAKIYGEVLGGASSCVVSANHIPDRQQAMTNALTNTLKIANIAKQDVSHIHAHGLSTQATDREEARAINSVFGEASRTLPVVAAKSYLGNAGGGAGALELAASLLAIQDEKLFPTLNFSQPDPECPIAVVQTDDVPAGDLFLNLNVTPQGQSSCLAIRKVA